MQQVIVGKSAIQMEQVKLCSSPDFSFIKRTRFLFCAFLFLYVNYAYGSYLKNDFRDDANTTHTRGLIELLSDKLPPNIFEKDWQSMPPHNEENSAFGERYFDVYYNFTNFKIGILREEKLKTTINDGFIQTWYYAEKDFITLLTKSDIGNEIDTVDIDADLNYYDAYGLFAQKIIPFYEHHFLSIKAKLYSASEIQYLDVKGYNNSSRFELSFDYYYARKNYISKNQDGDKGYSGLGFGVDLEYIYDNDKLYIYGGILNIGSFIEWKNITLMHYDFDSQTRYLGADGFYHLKAFGSGFYEFNVDYRQKLPMQYKATLEYSINDDFSIGTHANGYKDLMFHELYLSHNICGDRYKIGYMLETKNASFGAYFKYISLEISNNFGMSSRSIQANYHIKY